MADPNTQPSKSGAWEGFKAGLRDAASDIGAEMQRGAADIGSTYQACLYSGWHTQSAAIELPEHIAEDAAKQQIQDKVEPEKESPTVGLEKE